MDTHKIILSHIQVICTVMVIFIWQNLCRKTKQGPKIKKTMTLGDEAVLNSCIL